MNKEVKKIIGKIKLNLDPIPYEGYSKQKMSKGEFEELLGTLDNKKDKEKVKIAWTLLQGMGDDSGYRLQKLLNKDILTGKEKGDFLLENKIPEVPVSLIIETNIPSEKKVQLITGRMNKSRVIKYSAVGFGGIEDIVYSDMSENRIKKICLKIASITEANSPFILRKGHLSDFLNSSLSEEAKVEILVAFLQVYSGGHSKVPDIAVTIFNSNFTYNNKFKIIKALPNGYRKFYKGYLQSEQLRKVDNRYEHPDFSSLYDVLQKLNKHHQEELLVKIAKDGDGDVIIKDKQFDGFKNLDLSIDTKSNIIKLSITNHNTTSILRGSDYKVEKRINQHLKNYKKAELLYCVSKRKFYSSRAVSNKKKIKIILKAIKENNTSYIKLNEIMCMDDVESIEKIKVASLAIKNNIKLRCQRPSEATKTVKKVMDFDITIEEQRKIFQALSQRDVKIKKQEVKELMKKNNIKDFVWERILPKDYS